MGFITVCNETSEHGRVLTQGINSSLVRTRLNTRGELGMDREGCVPPSMKRVSYLHTHLICMCMCVYFHRVYVCMSEYTYVHRRVETRD